MICKVLEEWRSNYLTRTSQISHPNSVWVNIPILSITPTHTKRTGIDSSSLIIIWQNENIDRKTIWMRVLWCAREVHWFTFFQNFSNHLMSMRQSFQSSSTALPLALLPQRRLFNGNSCFYLYQYLVFTLNLRYCSHCNQIKIAKKFANMQYLQSTYY